MTSVIERIAKCVKLQLWWLFTNWYIFHT